MSVAMYDCVINHRIAAIHIVRSDDGPNWQLRFQVQLMFPK